MQKQKQPPPEEMLRMQMQRERIQGAAQNTEMKSIFDLVREIVKQEMGAQSKAGGNAIQ